ncbi:pyrokinin-1 receptor-like [Anthonomus grandis grandis]|uniref:pyrokinin-1 receptor-like n=1 Tax=Anthonomus grandis grandis TaxID=2921223 RepID=UPI002165CBE0|nr:pyrokinin-1 receptor-like [Anthonomus grandis grandis]
MSSTEELLFTEEKIFYHTTHSSSLNLTSLNQSAEYQDNLYPLELVIPFTTVYAIIFLTGVIGNISTCIVIAKNKSMHTATNYYLFSLAVSDMLLLISGLPPEMYRIWSPDTYIFGHVICFLQGFSAETSANATVLTITAFTVERYLAICHPFLAHTMSKLSRCVRIILMIWIVALTLAVPQAIQFGIQVRVEETGKQVSECNLVSTIFTHAFEVSTLVFFVAPMTLITVLYILIGRQLKQSTAKRPSLTQHSSSCTPSRYSSHFGNNDAAKKRRQTQAQNRVVKMLIAVVAAFFICWAPFHAQRLLAVYLAGASKEAQDAYFQVYLYLMYTSGVLYYLSTCINPLLYHIMSNKYRNAFKKTFHNICKRSSRSKNYIEAPLRSKTLKKYPENFLGEAVHLAQTADARTSSNRNWCKHSVAKLTPETSQTSFSSSKIETSQALLRNDLICNGVLAPDNSATCAAFKVRFLKLFKTGLTQGYVNQNRLNKQGSNTISNSSLKDTDEMDLVCADLVKQMKQVNDVL